MKSLNTVVYPVVVALSLVAAASARAESPFVQETSQAAFVQTKTRAQVESEYFQARADGSLKVTSITYNHMAAVKSLRSRDEVRAEAVAANKIDSDSLWLGEDSGSFELARSQPVRMADRIVAAR